MNSIIAPTTAVFEITYSQLECQLEEYLNTAGKQSQTKNYRTTIKTWRETFNLTESSSVGRELDIDFDENLKIYQRTQAQAGIKEGTYASRLSHLRAIQKLFQTTTAPSVAPTTFSTALSVAMQKAGFKSPSEFHRKCVSDICRIQPLSRWYYGKSMPCAKSLPIIEEFERRLSAEEGTLTSLLPKRFNKISSNRKAGITSYGRKIMALKSKPYRFWTTLLQKEWAEFETLMTLPYLPEGQKRRSVWTRSDGGNNFPSSEKSQGTLKQFFGFCRLPASNDPLMNGLGMTSQELTLALLTDKNLIERYLEFQKVRAGGIYTKGTLAFIGLVIQLLSAETGYLYQHPYYAKKLNVRISASRWRAVCTNTYERMRNIRTQLEQQKLIVKGRDPEEPIKDILAQERPLHVLLRMLGDMQRDLLLMKSSPVWRALHYRNILLIGLISSNPLRSRHFSIMKFDQHLKRRRNGEWWLEFKKEEFKNRHALNSNYTVRVERHMWPIIERYRGEFRPLLQGADECDYVFRPAPGSRVRTKGQPIPRAAVFNLLQGLTYSYIDESPGFGPHAFRHIVATDIIKKNPEFGFFLASKALHDRVETVERAYGHLKTHEFFEPVNRHFACAWEEVIGKESWS